MRSLGMALVVMVCVGAMVAPVGANSVELADTAGDVGQFPSLALKPNGFPTIAYHDEANGDLKIRSCADAYCVPGSGTTVTVAAAGDVGERPAMILEEFTAAPIVSYYNETNLSLQVLRCTNNSCTSGGTITTPDQSSDPFESVGSSSAIALDAAGNPIVVYSYQKIISLVPVNVVFQLRVLRCDDPICAPGGDTITVVDAAGGVSPSMQLAQSTGNPVISYYQAGTLKLLRCGSVGCSAGNTTSTPDATANNVGRFNSLALDQADRPVVAYYDATDGALKIYRCSFVSCGPGSTITTPDNGGDAGSGVSLRLDEFDNPVVAYYGFGGPGDDELRVLHCDDPGCALGGDSISRPIDAPAALAGADISRLSLALDDSGLPVIAGYEPIDGDLQLLRCDDPNCTRTVYVDESALTGSSDGSSWDNAFTELVPALLAVEPGEIIRIAEGIYLPGAVGNRAATFDLTGLTVIGGYSSGGTAGPNLSSYPTVLSGDLSSNDASAAIGHASRSENAYHVVTIGAATSHPTALNHLVIGGGNANSGGADGSGAGILVTSDVQMQNVTVAANTASSASGILVKSPANLDFSAGVIRDNNAVTSGAGVGVESTASLVLSRTTVANNKGSGFGGAIENAGSAHVANSVLALNESYDGGGIGNSGALTVTNTLFASNNANGEGGAIVDFGTSTLTNVTIGQNTAVGGSGGILGNSGTNLTNSIVWGNGAAPLGGTGLTVATTIVEGGYGSNPSSDPEFINPTAFNFRLAGTSPATDVGSNFAVPADSLDVDADGDLTEPTPDLDLVARIQNGTVDLGAYESAGTLDGLTVIDPCVVYDSVGAGDGALAPGGPKTAQVSGALSGQGGSTNCGVSAGATAVVFTVSAIDPQGLGNLRLSEAGVAPAGGVVNYTANGLNNSNTVTVPLSATGAVDVEANVAATGVRLVAIGYYSASGTLRYVPLTPCAVADSRSTQNPQAPFIGPFAAASNYPDIDVTGTFSSDQGGNQTDCGVPDGVDAVVVNVVAVASSGGAGGLAVGVGGSEPVEPTTNFAALNFNNAAVAIVPVDASGKIALNITALSGSPLTHVRLVVLGYVDDGAGPAGLDYNATNPCAIFDTRTGQGAAPAFFGKRNGGSTTTYQITGIPPVAQGGVAAGCGIPLGADAVLINLVAVQGQIAGNLRAYATGSVPTGGVLNFAAASPTVNNSNAVIVPLSALGQLNIDVNTFAPTFSEAVDIRGVILGYFN